MPDKKYTVIGTVAVFLIICAVAGMLFMMPDASADAESDRMAALLSGFSLGSDTADLALIQIAQDLSRIPADDPETTRILLGYYAEVPYTEGIFRVSRTGDITAAVPSSKPGLSRYLIPSGYTGENLAAGKVYIDHLYNLETGDTDVALSVPVYGDAGYAGTVTAVYNPTGLFGSVLSAVPDTEEYLIWILDKDGTILYGPDSTAIGTSIRTTSAIEWPELSPLVSAILENRSGVSEDSAYSYLQLKNINRVVAWDTVSAWGRNLTIVLANDLSGGRKVPLPMNTSGLTPEQYAVSAYEYAKEHGTQAALTEFNNPDSGFFTTDIVFVALDMNETVLAYPYRPELAGVSRPNYRDAYGVPVYKMTTMRAQQGGGYTLFLYQDPQNNLETRMLLGYVIPADDEDWYIFAGTFLNGTIPVRPDLMDELAVFARSIHQFIELTDRNAAITSLNNENEQFLNPRNIQYGIFDYNGTALVWPHNPDRIGTSALGMTDIYGGSLIRDLITYAKEGGGFMYQYYPDTRTGESLLKLVYVEPLGGDQLLVANIPLI